MSNENFKEDFIEIKNNKYTYRDYSKKPVKVVFECFAEDIIEADKQYEAELGKNPEKLPLIGCEITPYTKN